jgi:hypothetical protein
MATKTHEKKHEVVARTIDNLLAQARKGPFSMSYDTLERDQYFAAAVAIMEAGRHGATVTHAGNKVTIALKAAE